MIVDIDGVPLDLKVRDGVLEVGRPDKTWIGSVYVGPEPDQPDESAPAPDVAPKVAVLPAGWTQDPDGNIRTAEGKSIFGVTATEEP